MKDLPDKKSRARRSRSGIRIARHNLSWRIVHQQLRRSLPAPIHGVAARNWFASEITLHGHSDVPRSIAYESRTTRPLSSAKLDALLADARLFNATVDVTGVLFHHSGRFFQYFEGPPDGVSSVYRRIQESSSHTDIQELFVAEMPRRYFDTWQMGFCETPETVFQELANASWEQSMPITRDEWEGFEGLRLAVYYWNKWSADKSGSDLLAVP